MINYFHCYAKTLAGELNPDLKANLNEHPSICKSYVSMENYKINSLANLLEYSLSAEILSEWKIELIVAHLVRNFQINWRNEPIAKCLLTFSHYTRPHLKYVG